MDNWTFGWTLIVVGMGGTLAVLTIFSLIMGLLKRLFPIPSKEIEGEGVGDGTGV